jgi:hypothetical protein
MRRTTAVVELVYAVSAGVWRKVEKIGTGIA